MRELDLPNISLRFADLAISAGRDFGVPASARARKELRVNYGLRGYNPYRYLGYFGTPSRMSNSSEMPQEYYLDMSDQMERFHVSYIVESYNTVIGWRDSEGNWRIPPFRYSLTTTEHQHTMCGALGISWHSIDTTRVILSDDVRIGRPGF